MANNYERQLQSLIDITGYEKVVKHILGTSLDQVSVGMQLSHDLDGVLTSLEVDTISSLS